MHSDPLDSPRLAALLAELRAEYGSVPVQPNEQVAALFTAAAPAAAGSFVAIHPVRRRPMVSDMLKSLPGKVAAGFIGATLAWSGLGIAGAMPGPLTLAADDTELACPAEDETTVTTDGTTGTDGDTTGTEDSATGAEDSTTDECDDATDEDASDDDATDGDATDDSTNVATEDDASDDDATDDDSTDDENAADGELPAVPTSVSEAAHIHDFDEACGNHGKYVSHFARTGTEPGCATGARGDEDGEDAAATDDAVETESVEDDADKKAKADKQSGKGKGGKGKGGKGKSR